MNAWEHNKTTLHDYNTAIVLASQLVTSALILRTIVVAWYIGYDHQAHPLAAPLYPSSPDLPASPNQGARSTS